MPVVARSIIAASMRDLIILGEGDEMTPPMANDALEMLNWMVSGWQIQSGTIPCIQRTLFPLVANKQTYTIGLGGDFNVPRPTANIPGAGLLMQGLTSPESITSMTRSGYAVTVTQAAHPFSVGDAVSYTHLTLPTSDL